MYDEKLLHEMITRISEAMKEIGESFKELAEKILGAFDDIEKEKQKYQPVKTEHHVPLKIVSRSQVINRKPRIIFARSNC
jgi:flagellar motor switch protein FliG